MLVIHKDDAVRLRTTCKIYSEIFKKPFESDKVMFKVDIVYLISQKGETNNYW